MGSCKPSSPIERNFPQQSSPHSWSSKNQYRCAWLVYQSGIRLLLLDTPVAEFKEFEWRFKFKPRLKYGWFHLKCFKIQAGAKFKPGFGGFKPRLKFFKFHLSMIRTLDKGNLGGDTPGPCNMLQHSIPGV